MRQRQCVKPSSLHKLLLLYTVVGCSCAWLFQSSTSATRQLSWSKKKAEKSSSSRVDIRLDDDDDNKQRKWWIRTHFWPGARWRVAQGKRNWVESKMTSFTATMSRTRPLKFAWVNWLFISFFLLLSFFCSSNYISTLDDDDVVNFFLSNSFHPESLRIAQHPTLDDDCH